MAKGNDNTSNYNSSPHPEEMDRLLWEYIDGSCTPAESTRIALLVKNDERWRTTYDALISFQAELSDSMELQEPHLRFTQNVMETIAMQPAPAIRRYINNAVIRGLAAVFAVSIGITLLLILITTNWSAPAHIISTPQLRMPAVDFSSIYSAAFFNVAIGVAVILGLIFLDNTIRVRRMYHRS